MHEGAGRRRRWSSCGAGKVLTGLVKRIDKEIEPASRSSTPADVEALLKTRSAEKEQCMFDLTGKTRWSPAPRAASAARSRGRCTRRARRWRCRGTRRRGAGGAEGASWASARMSCRADLDDAGRDRARWSRTAEAALGRLDILVNNAGITRDNLAMRMKDEDWEKVLEVNLTAGFRLARAAMRGMMKQRCGRIIGITSVVGVTGNPGPGQLRRRQGRADRHVQVAGPGGRARAASRSTAWRRASSRRR